MKKKILFTIAFYCCSLCMFTSCSNDYNDATSKHVYGENENPYLRIDTEAQISVSGDLEVKGAHSYVVSLSDYAAKFEQELGMNLDAVLNGLASGETVFYPINITRNQWLKTAYNKDNSGWYFNSANQPCTADDETCKASVTLDKASKELVFELTDGGIVDGTVLAIEVGFAKNGSDYDDYIRFTLNANVTDPTLAVLSLAFSSEDSDPIRYIKMEDYAEQIEKVFDISYDEFLVKAAANQDIRFCLGDVTTGQWKDLGANYTNSIGYWLNSQGASVSNTEGVISIEYDSVNERCEVHSNSAAETSGKFAVGWVDMNDTSKYFCLNISWEVD